MSSAEVAGDGGGSGDVHVVVEVTEAGSAADADAEIEPLLAEAGRKPPRMTIFSVSYPKRRPSKEPTPRAVETEVALLYQIIMWAWSGSRYSGLLCMASSATIYYFMEVLMDILPVRSIPLFETVFTRCTVISILSIVWLRRTGQPLCAPAHTRNILFMRSLTGLISLLSFIYSVQNLPLSYAVLLNFATPIMASIGAKIILKENWALPDIGGLVFSFLGLLFIFRPILTMRGGLSEIGESRETSNAVSSSENYPVYPILVGILSSALGGINYCFMRSGTKASDQPVYTVLSFGILASPVSAICIFALQEIVLPNLFTFCTMIMLGVMAFLAELSLARGLQLEKISKVANILYIKVLLSQVWSMTFLGTASSFSQVMGCLLILVSVCSTLYLGPEREIE